MKSSQDPFYLEDALKNIKAQAAFNAKCKAVERPSRSRGAASPDQKMSAVGGHTNLLPIVVNDLKKWPKDSDLIKDHRGIPNLRNKKTGELMHHVKPENMKGRTTKSIQDFFKTITGS